VKLEREAGMVPARSLTEICSWRRPGGNSVGKGPTKLFRCSHSTLRLEQFVKLGIAPCSVLLLSNRYCNRWRWPRDAGISPVNRFVARERFLRNVRLPSEGEIWPTRPSLSSRMEATRRGLVVVQRMASQLQKWVLWFHEAKACCGSSVIDLLKSSSDNRSVSFASAELQVTALQAIISRRNCPIAAAFMVISS